MSSPIPLSRVGTPRSARYARSPLRDNNGPGSAHEAKEIRPPWKRDLYLLMEHATSSQAAFLIHIFTTTFIIISAIITVLETVPAFHSISGRIWFGLETSLVAIFTVEYIARCIAHSNNWRSAFAWFTSFFGVIDLLGILPYYVEIILQQDTSTFFRFTILRTFRLLRVFKPFRYNNTILLTIEVMFLSFRRSQHALLALAFFVLMVLIVFSTLLYFAERGTWDDTLGIFMNSDGDPSQFSSIPAAAWFVLVTITTVGYGDITPRSFFGRLVTLPLLVFGLLLIALPTFVLGREFSLVWDMMKMAQDQAPDDVIPSPSTSPILSRRLRPGAISTLSVNRVPDDVLFMEGTLRQRFPAAVPTSEKEYGDLISQVSELRATVEKQNETILRIMQMLEGKGKQRAVAENGSPLAGNVWR
ncbi:hypothetical protein ABKN59_007514 [Abortiporus biennis]